MCVLKREKLNFNRANTPYFKKMKGKILIVEDDKSWQNILKQCLNKAGYYAVIAGDVETALELIIKERFHFITTGLSLEDDTSNPEWFGGWVVFRKVKQLRINTVTPVMVITGLEDEYLHFARENGLEADYFMGKGNFNEKELIEIINREVACIDLRFNDDHRDV
jgi:DNA-binding response OmpR family regulator